ncbi:MAG: EpsI family protein [Verrucomicrobiota bacterium]|nr:EpsI family protein [Verrucomicrobiota bacterium]
MTPKRLIILLIFLAAGFSSIFVLPTTARMQPVGIKLELPTFVGKWYGVDQEITARELEMLAGDTEFARKLYTDASGNSIFVSIVLSGSDLDNSIHRPERCLPAQGWTIADSDKLRLPLASDQKLAVTRLHNVRQAPLENGTTISIYNLNYYWFVGYHHLTASHLERTMFDIQDRVFKGFNQRWAYITVASTITKGLVPFGRTEAETDTIIQDFIRQIYPAISKPAGEPAIATRSQTPAEPASL